MKKLTFNSLRQFLMNHPQYRFLQESEKKYLTRCMKCTNGREYPPKNGCYWEIGQDLGRKFGYNGFSCHFHLDAITGQRVRRDDDGFFPGTYLVYVHTYFSTCWLPEIEFTVRLGHTEKLVKLTPRSNMEITPKNVEKIVRQWLSKNYFLEGSKYRMACIWSAGDKTKVKDLLLKAWRMRDNVVPDNGILKAIRRKYNVGGYVPYEEMIKYGRSRRSSKKFVSLARFNIWEAMDYLGDTDDVEGALAEYESDMGGCVLI